MDMSDTLQTLFLVCLVSAAAPLVTTLVGGHLPQVVLLLVGGVLIGPEVLGIAEPELVELIAEVGLGFLFLIAGYEVEPSCCANRWRSARTAPGPSRSSSPSSSWAASTLPASWTPTSRSRSR